jgi:hypothetical protein
MSDTPAPICGHRWWAPRVEVPDSVPVLHVCVEPAGRDQHPTRLGLYGPLHNEHACACGATLCGDGPGPDGPARAWTAAAAPLGGDAPTWSTGWRGAWRDARSAS